MQVKWRHSLALLGALAALVLFVSRLPEADPARDESPAERAAREAADNLLGAQYACELALENRLADSEGFDPQPYGDWRVDASGAPERLAFQFEARVRNGFGALVWQRFDCTAVSDGASYTVEVVAR